MKLNTVQDQSFLQKISQFYKKRFYITHQGSLPKLLFHYKKIIKGSGYYYK